MNPSKINDFNVQIISDWLNVFDTESQPIIRLWNFIFIWRETYYGLNFNIGYTTTIFDFRGKLGSDWILVLHSMLWLDFVVILFGTEFWLFSHGYHISMTDESFNNIIFNNKIMEWVLVLDKLALILTLDENLLADWFCPW